METAKGSKQQRDNSQYEYKGTNGYPEQQK